MVKNGKHVPVLLKETIEFLHIKRQARYIDATLGTGGHSIEIIKRGGRVLGIDADPAILKVARKNIEACPATEGKPRWSYKLVRGNFKDIKVIAGENGFYPVDGILADLGISSFHLEKEKRGFSFNKGDEPLDMRLDPSAQGVRAADLLNALGKKELVDTFEFVLGRTRGKRLSQEIINFRQRKKIEKVEDFLKIVEKVGLRSKRIHPATKPFMALRMRVNSELENLTTFLPDAFGLLDDAGRMVIISFHSLEDRIVKHFMKAFTKHLKILTKKPVIPSKTEIEDNPRARSAKLRVFEKI